jgi:hypothetical protein
VNQLVNYESPIYKVVIFAFIFAFHAAHPEGPATLMPVCFFMRFRVENTARPLHFQAAHSSACAHLFVSVLLVVARPKGHVYLYRVEDGRERHRRSTTAHSENRNGGRLDQCRVRAG